MRNAWNTYRQGARRRDLVWELTWEDFSSLVTGECFYCGFPAPEGLANGVDRYDNSKGYTQSNSKTACSQCNYAKRTQTPEDFIAWAQRIVDFQGD